LLFLFSAFLERISNIAGKAMKKAEILSVLKSSLNNNQAAKIGINNDSRWAASVFTIPICFIDAARKRKMAGSKMPRLM
jgi:hypothetical protein